MKSKKIEIGTSKCCGAAARSISGNEGTGYFQCTVCLQACDVKTKTQRVKKILGGEKE